MNVVSFLTSWHSLLMLTVWVDSSNNVNLIVRGAVSCKDCQKLWDLCFTRCIILLMTEHPHRHRGSCLSCFCCRFTLVSEHHQWWMMEKQNKGCDWVISLPSENRSPLAHFCACFILVLLKFWTNRFFGCCCGRPKQRRVPPSKTGRFQIHVFPPTSRKSLALQGLPHNSPSQLCPFSFTHPYLWQEQPALGLPFLPALQKSLEVTLIKIMATS